MRRIILIALLNCLLVSHSYAATWTKLQDNKHATLMLDKQSITPSGKFDKAWVKINYKSLQTNLEYPEKSYNNAKLLWYFDCAAQKSATAQVYQLLDEEQIFSAAIDVKRARFLEPVPETEIDIAMQYVCKQKANKEALKEKVEAAKTAHEEAQKTQDKAEKAPEKPVATPESPPATTEVAKEDKAADVKAEEPKKDEPKKEEKADEQDDKKNKTDDHASDDSGDEKLVESKKSTKKDKDGDKADLKAKSDEHDEDDVVDDEKHASSKDKKHKDVHWKYKGSTGPENWGELSPEFISCKVGRNQSPIDISKTLVTTPKSLKTFQSFPITEVLNNGHTVQANFKPGNIMVVDSVMYQMKQVHFHAPSENQILGKSYPLEAHFVHADPDGNLAVLAVMYELGNENKGIAKLWKQMPKTKGQTKPLTSKVLAGDLIPRKKEYYRFSGSLTTPPCSEGVIWIVMKSTMTVSNSQVDAFKKVMREDNNRPIQPLNGRMVIE
jgi:carbonic anhydrase